MKAITYSKNVFLPLTHVCSNACGYCSFKEPVRDGCVLSADDAKLIIQRGAAARCTEALFTFGDNPELEPGFSGYLKKTGYTSILDYAYDLGKYALACGLLPHTNAGVIGEEQMKKLRTVNPSMGLMLETTARIKAHEYSPRKDPEVRIEMIATAGRLKIPFTTGLLLGIGETRDDRIESLETIAGLHRRYRHIQEVIIQNFCPKPGTDMADIPGASPEILLDTIQLATEILPDDISIQAAANLISVKDIMASGITDLGGVSPVTIDYVNPEHPWPELETLKKTITDAGCMPKERLCIYEKYCTDEWVDEGLLPTVKRMIASLQ